MNEHRVPMLGGAWRRRSDPARSSDPRVRELVGALAGVEVAPPMRADFRAELRAQLVAVTPRLVEEGEAAPPAPASRATKRAPKAERAADADQARRFRFAKPLVAVACALTAFVLLLGGAVLISRNALPGDALYGIKRASEDTEYSFTSGTVAKGKLKLQFAATRIGEVSDLLAQPSAMAAGTGAIADSGQPNSDTANLVRETLGSADSDVKSASQMLTGDAVRNDRPASLAAITSWTPAQITAMRQIVARIPAGSLHQRALMSLGVLQQAQQRATALQAELGCSCLTSVPGDQFGPVPCTTPCSTRQPGGSGKHPTSTPSRTPVNGRTPPTGNGRSAGVVPATTTPRTSILPGSTPTRSNPGGHLPAPSSSILPSKSPVGGPTSPKLPLPSLPSLGGGKSGTGSGAGHSGTKLPIKVTSSCVSAGVGGIGVGIGNC
jgi:hypothetical protein